MTREIKVYNTMSRQKEVFSPLEPGKVGIYVCGVTPYNDPHIGNARPFVTWDVIRRFFAKCGYAVRYIQNFTDVDDKIIRTANERGVTWKDVADQYIDAYFRVMDELNVRRADVYPRVSETIPEIIEMVQGLVDKGFAYELEGDVYYSVESFATYGKLSGRNLDDMMAGARVEVDERKKNPMDFALWKSAKPGEPYWESPWGKGRPGWHIECSVMSKRYLGDTIDIHAGGEDLIFPHHENEIAQSEAANGVPFAHYWMHNGFLNIDNKKMSKSLGNFFTVRDISEKYELQVLRFFMLSAHYRSPLNFSDELMESAKSGLDRIRECADNLRFCIEQRKDTQESESENGLFAETDVFVKKFEDAMEDDCNTADAISAIFEYVRYINQHIDGASGAFLQRLYDRLSKLCDVLGIIIEKKEESLDSDIEALIEERQAARKNKDFAKADEIRDKLLEMGIELKDTREGVKWNRI